MASDSHIEELRRAYAAGDIEEALRVAVRIKDLGAQGRAIRKAWSAIHNPGLYRQLGQCPRKLVEAGTAALERRYGLKAAE